MQANVVKEVAPIFGGGGGGRPNFAQGGGTKPDKLQDAVKAAEETVKKQLDRKIFFSTNVAVVYSHIIIYHSRCMSIV